jgi:RHS repeat-associated protein
MSGTGHEIADILDDSAKKIGPALGEDFSGAYKNILHDTGTGLKSNAERVTQRETDTAKTFSDVKPDEAPADVHGGSGSGSGGGHSSGGASEPTPVPLSSVGHPHAESTPVGDRPSGGDPVDLVTGEMFLLQGDLALPGVLPVTLERVHLSNYRKGRWFGRTWASSLDQRVEVDEDGIHYAAPDGMVLHYPVPGQPGERVWAAAGPRWPLRWDRERDTIEIEQPESGRALRFPPGPAPETCRPLAAIVDRNGNQLMFSYDRNGVPVAVRHTGGYHVAVESVVTGLGTRISALDLVEPRSGERTRIVSFDYDARGRLTDVVNSSGLPLVFEYDHEDRITAWSDRLGRRYEYHYDPSGRVSRTDGTGRFLAASFDYDLDERVTTLTDSLGHTTRHHWNERNQVVKVVGARGGETVTERDRHGRLLSSTDELGRTLRVHRDEAGDPLRIERPDGAVVELGFSGAAARPSRLVGPGGVEWNYAYDARGNLVAVGDPAGAVTRFEYGERGELTAVTDAVGQVVRYRNNAAGLPVAVTDASGSTTTIERDAFGRVTAVTDPLGAVSRTGWTVEGKRAWRSLPDGTREEWEYDPEGSLVEHRGRHRAVTRYEYGPFDELVARTDPDGAHFAFGYDTELRLRTVTDARGLSWSYEYGPEGELVSETDFDGRTLSYAYDAAGRLVERVNGAGQRTAFAYDELDRIVERRAQDDVYRFVYDAAGRVSCASGPGAVAEYTRDAVGRVLTESVNGRTMAYEYDALGRVLTRTTPTGAVSRWTYDAAGAAATLSAGGRSLESGRDAAGRETSRTLGGGAAVSQAFDELGRMTGQALWAYGDAAAPPSAPAAENGYDLLQHRTYEYRADGSPVEIADRLRGTRRYELDAAGRVTAVRAPGWTESYAYDASGNLAGASAPGDGDTQGEREFAGTVLRRAGRTAYEHDAQGRLVRSTRRTLSGQVKQWSYTWDADDRLTAVTVPDGTTWRYRYDPLGRRIAKLRLAENGETAEEIWFSWDGERLAEQAAVTADGRAEVLTWDWEPAGHRVAAQTRRRWTLDGDPDAVDTAFYGIVTDLVGTPTELVTADGRIAWHATTSLWGLPAPGPLAEDASSAPAGAPEADCPLRFPGQYHDAETGLHYNLLRYYDPANGAYISPDPLGLLPAPNHRAYVQNPLTWLDPLGLMGSCFSKVDEEETGYQPSPNHTVPTHYSDNPPANVYRMDTRPPAEIAANGFAPRPGAAGGLTLWGHVSRTYPDRPGYSRDDSQWISTGQGTMLHDGVVAGMIPSHHLYRIDTTQTGGRFADVNATFGDHVYANQNEFAHEGAIPAGAVTGYMPPGGVMPHFGNALDNNTTLDLDNVPGDAWTGMPQQQP